MRSRNAEIVIYDKVKKYTKEEIKAILDSKITISNYCFIYHDKDIYTSEDADKEEIPLGKKIGDLKDFHYHIFIKCKDAWDFEYFGKWFGIASNNVNKLKCKYEVAIGYAIHFKQNNKYQYSASEVISKNNDYAVIDAEEEKANKEIFDFDNVPLIEYKKKYNQNAKELRNLKTLYDNYLEIKAKEKLSRSMQVIYINGTSGSGKTTFAKALALKMFNNAYEISISSSSNDALQDYEGEKCLILDDLRGDAFKMADLLKILDNNTNSSAKARYKNKMMQRCELIIITSVRDIENLYNKDNEGEEMKQLYRRCKTSFNVCKIDNKYYATMKVYNEVKNCYEAVKQLDITEIIEEEIRSNLNRNVPWENTLAEMGAVENYDLNIKERADLINRQQKEYYDNHNKQMREDIKNGAYSKKGKKINQTWCEDFL